MLKLVLPPTMLPSLRSGQKTQAIIGNTATVSLGDRLEILIEQRPHQGTFFSLAECTKVLPVVIQPLECRIFVDGERLNSHDWAAFAHAEGYSSIGKLFDAYCPCYAGFSGQILVWQLLEQVPEVA